MRNANIIAAILRKRANAGGGDSDADAIIAALGSAGVTLSGAEESAIQTFVGAGKTDGWWALSHRLYFPIHGIAAANALDWINLGSGTFSGSWTHAAGYAQGAAGAYFQMADDVSGLVSTSSATLAAYVAGSGGSDNLIGWNAGATNRGRINFFSGSAFFEWCSTTARCTGSAGADYDGLWVGSRHSGSWYLRRKKTAGIASIASASGADGGSVSTSPLIAGGSNTEAVTGVTLANECQDPMRVFYLADGMSTATSDAFSNAAYTLLTAFGLSLV